MDVEVTRSARRTKTVQARLVDGVLHIAIPAHLTEDEERHWIDVMQRRFAAKRDANRIDLTERAHELAETHDLPRPTSIEWSSRQRTLWGSCTVDEGRIRVSERVAAFPSWVVDYVIVHELAHLENRSHDRDFWHLVGRYPMAERARGYLIAKGEGTAEASDP